MPECIDVMDAALRALARGDALLPLRSLTKLPVDSSVLALMPAWLGEPAAFGVKVISWFPSNHGTPYDAHQGAVLLFEPEHGQLIAVIDASAVTAIRTAAVSAVATRALASEDAAQLAIIGTGIQAGTHLEAMCAVRPFERIRVFSPEADARERFASRARRNGFPVVAAESTQEAVSNAQVVCTVTAATTPVLERRWLSPGVHINAVGACTPKARELDSDTVADARLYVDRRESALNEAGDFLIPRAEGRLADGHIIGELGDLLLGRVPGRSGPRDITLFKSLGLAIEDVAAAHRIYANAIERGAGIRVELGDARAVLTT
jgi:ornithine cyclodeaminase